MTCTTIPLRQFIEDAAIVAVSRSSEPSDRPEWVGDSDAWLVTLINQPAGQTMTTWFYTGPGLRNRMADGPEAADVLDVLLSEAAGYLNAAGFEDWAAEQDLNPDSRAAEQTYREIGEQVERLRVFLGELFDDAVWRTEGL